MRFFVNAVALAVTALVLPNLEIVPFEGRKVFSILVLAAIFGVLNAAVKPLLQALLLPFFFETSGLAVVLVNTGMFALLDLVASGLIEIRLGVTYFVAGLVVYAIALVLENVLGVTPPIVRDEAVSEKSGH
jgi:putative membrane protein